ncbi:MAG: hypothetical protein V2A58_04885 [Planctomycetota bacterium]
MAKGVLTCPTCQKRLTVWASCEDGLHATVVIESDCPNMRNLQATLYGVTVDVDRDRRISGLQGFNYSTNTVFSAAERTIKDASCLAVPFIIRVVEVAAGVARPGEGTFTITDEKAP